MNNILFSFPSLPIKLILIFFFIILSNNKILSLFFAPLAYPISFPYYSYYKKVEMQQIYSLSYCERGLLKTKKFFAMHDKVIYLYLHICVLGEIQPNIKFNSHFMPECLLPSYSKEYVFERPSHLFPSMPSTS